MAVLSEVFTEVLRLFEGKILEQLHCRIQHHTLTKKLQPAAIVQLTRNYTGFQ